MLESHLTTLEKKIDDLLASFEPSEVEKVTESSTKSSEADPQASTAKAGDVEEKPDGRPET